MEVTNGWLLERFVIEIPSRNINQYFNSQQNDKKFFLFMLQFTYLRAQRLARESRESKDETEFH